MGLIAYKLPLLIGFINLIFEILYLSLFCFITLPIFQLFDILLEMEISYGSLILSTRALIINPLFDFIHELRVPIIFCFALVNIKSVQVFCECYKVLRLL